MNLTKEDVIKVIDYDPASGSFKWKSRDGYAKKFSGKRAGFVRKYKSGYENVHIRILGKVMLGHRLAWLYMNGSPIPAQIDHINHDATDNRWCNLRAADDTINTRNQSKYKNNTSGVSGVSFKKSTGRWVARVRVKGVENHLGTFAYEDLDLAAMEVMEFRAEHGFDPSHGMEFAPYHNVGAIK